jgi:tight adherence protein B
MEALVSALSAGYSMENAVHEVKKDLMLIYPEKSLILCETRYILQQVSLDVGLDVLFTDLGERSGCEDIIDFACIYATVKRTGGNLITVMKQTAQNISDKIEIKREIDTLISGKKLEAKFMCMIPIFMILYLRIFSPGFIDPLYEGFTGRLLMTAALIIYAGSAFWIRKVISIERI